jgi:glycerol kinase
MDNQKQYILALDQGTTSSRAILFDRQGLPVAIEKQEYTQHYPLPGRVEHDPEDIWFTQLSTARRVLRAAGITAAQIAAIGITNQRETTVLWDRATGVPIGRAIVWQDRRTAAACAELQAAGHAPRIREITGLPLDPYFSGTKLAWMLDQDPELRKRAERGDLAFGTVDSFLLYRLTGGRVHATDPSNASRTLLFSLQSGSWDSEMLSRFQIPEALLPEVRPSSGYFGEADADLFGGAIPINGIAGDQQAASFGQALLKPGMVKCTFGTGSFLLMNTGDTIPRSSHGLLSTAGWDLGHGLNYALEGSVFVSGAAIQWLRDELQIIRSSDEIEPLAASVPDSAGVVFVPAFAGLGAPYWDPDARGALLGLTRGTGRAHIARAALEAVCCQTKDVLDAMEADSGEAISELRVDGGMTVNSLLMQMQADLLGVPVVRPKCIETTALGAAFLAGLGCGFWQGTEAVESAWQEDVRFTPHMSAADRHQTLDRWHRAVGRVRS